MHTPSPLPRRPSTRLFKAIGWLLITVGLLLNVGMAIIARYMIGVVNAPVLPGHSPSWAGNHEFTVHMFWMFGGVFLFGLLSLANGLWAVRHGALQPVLRTVAALLGVALFIAAVVINSQPE